MNSLVEINALSKRYEKGVMALDHLTLSIPAGRIIGLLGPNGSGKTTLIKLLNGLLVPTEGSILIYGFTPGVESKSMISYLPDRSSLPGGMRVHEIVSLFADFYTDFSVEKAYAMLHSLEIDSGKRLKSLSKGTQEKVQLVLAMSRQARLYILDEPIAGVDPAARDYILKTILTNYNGEASILLSTHLISDVENILDDVILIRDGRLLLQAGVEELREEKGQSLNAYFREVFAC